MKNKTQQGLALLFVGLCAVNQSEANPEFPYIKTTYKPGEITKICKNAIQEFDRKINEIVALKKEDQTFSNTVLAFEKIDSENDLTTTPLLFLHSVSPDSAIRKESLECQQALQKYSTELMLRKDLYLALKGSYDTSKLRSEEKRLRFFTLAGFEDLGVHLEGQALQEYKAKFERLLEIQTQFNDNLVSCNPSIEVSPQSLSGMPESWTKALQEREGKKVIPVTPPNYIQVMKLCSNGETRRVMSHAWSNRAAEENTPLLQEAIELRKDLAHIMGKKSWMDYRLDRRMAKNSETVRSFLEDLRIRLASRSQQELQALIDLKSKSEPDSPFQSYDFSYYENLKKKQDHSYDVDSLRPYFPAEKTTQNVFKLYSDIFGIQIAEVIPPEVWAEGVRYYRIQDKNTQNVLGYFYTDLYPRNGKFSHFAAFELQGGRQTPEGYQTPIAALVGNFTPATNDKPSLLLHSEVVTLFHEFGHIVHKTLTRAPYQRFAGTSVVTDFVEAPSQMLENWAFDQDVLKEISGHYETGEPLPDDLIEKTIGLRKFNQASMYSRQLLFATLDLTYHTAENPAALDVTKVYRDLHESTLGLSAQEGTHFPATFGHLMGGYDAGYYSYLWSEVISDDLFSKFRKTGLRNPETGAQYRSFILEQGGMQDALDLVEGFLGRKTNAEAFNEKLKQD